MGTSIQRYPGGAPFSDNSSSRRIFFGREKDARILADTILVNHITVVYGRSGLGKTSLLKAGVAPLIRENDYLPVFVRANYTDKSIFDSILETMPCEAERQGVEYVPGLPDSLWSFFKTVEFWRNDKLLIPVIILDQFEEIFTLQNETARESFLSELSYLIRGVLPPTVSQLMATTTYEGLSNRPPQVNFVLSLREDYLGFLEEAADQIPQIFDSRFRLSPLLPDAAKDAILKPARIDDPELNTQPFKIDIEAVDFILEYLSQHSPKLTSNTKRHIEPFQLQLICKQIERIAAAKQGTGHPNIIVSLKDLGWEEGIKLALRKFYSDAMNTISDNRMRKNAKSLCENLLISPHGKRISMEQSEASRLSGLTNKILSQLVESRLLRTETRAENTYYELSHDSLIEPIFAHQLGKKITLSLFNISFLGIGLLTLVSFVFAILVNLFDILSFDLNSYTFSNSEPYVHLLLFLIILSYSIPYFITRVSSSSKNLFRYRNFRDTRTINLELKTLSLRKKVISISAIVTGVVLTVLGILLLLTLSTTAHPESSWFNLDVIAIIIGLIAFTATGSYLLRYGIYQLALNKCHANHQSHNTKDIKKSRTKIIKSLTQFLFGIAFLIGSALSGLIALTILNCEYFKFMGIFSWLSPSWFSGTDPTCMTHISATSISRTTPYLVLIILDLLLAIPLLRNGIKNIQSLLPR